MAPETPSKTGEHEASPIENPTGRIHVSDRRALKPMLAALASAGFDFAVENRGRKAVITVNPNQEEAARHELDLVRQANRGWPPKGTLQPDSALDDTSDRDAFFAAALCTLALVAVFAAWGPYSDDWPLLARASTDAEKIRSGQWWRVFTAMTLHSGFPHLLGNALAALFLGTAAGLLCGPGAAWLLIVLAGAAANTATAWVVTPPFQSIGASTATFAALGMITLAQAVRNYRLHGRVQSIWHRSLVSLGAGVALLGILGTGADSDLRGHLYGFLFGALFGGAAALANSAKLNPGVQWLLFTASWALVACAWWTAAATTGG